MGHKIFAILFGTSATLTLVVLALTHYQVKRGFQAYVNQTQLSELEPVARALERTYSEKGQWQLPEMPSELHSRLAVVDSRRQLLEGSPAATVSPLRLPLMQQGKPLAYLALLPAPLPSSGPGQAFLFNQFRVVAMIGLLGLALSSLTAAFFADRVRKSIAHLLRATQRLAEGEFATRIPVIGQDELGQLASRLNHLAATLERGAESRKQWIADVSHELRTPLAVLRAEIEALQDGVRSAGPEAMELLHSQVMALTALTDDLFQLARSDLGQMNYKMQEVDLWAVLRDVTDHFQSRYQRAGLELSLVRDSNRLTSVVWADSDRLRQLLNNFLENSLRYTQAPGRVEVRCQSVAADWIVRVDDTPPGVKPEMLEKLFDRFFRVEGSRSKQLGGCGLGLSICQNIAQAHNGKLQASASPLGGLRLELILPCYPR